jgi:signal transduction histidine kinase
MQRISDPPKGGPITDLAADRIEDTPFSREGLRERLLPFAVLSAVAMVSVVLPHGGLRSWQQFGAGCALLALAAAAAFWVPWARLPAEAAVAVPLVYTASMLELTLSSGPTSGVGIVLLMPLVWSVLFHRRWESVWVLAAIVAAEAVISMVQSAPSVTLLRRMVLWAVLGTVVMLAAHGLRERIRRAHERTTALQEQLHQLTVDQDRNRIAADLGATVIQRLCAAGLDLHSAATRVTDEPARQRLLNGVSELDQAIRQLRTTVYDLQPDGGTAPPRSSPNSTGREG